MKKWISLGILVILTVIFAVGWSRHSQQILLSSDTPTELSASPTPALSIPSESDPSLALAINTPALDPAQLFSHVQALNFERYKDESRLQTREYIWQTLQAFGWSPQLQAYQNGGVNVWAKRPGTDPQAGAILVAAHYDTVPGSPGADDNATGIATVLEIARLLGSRPTPRALWVAFFDQEELGLLGSFAFSSGIPLTEVRGVIVMDMIGYACHTPGCQQYPSGLPIPPPSPTGNFLAVVGDAEHQPLLNAFITAKTPELPPAFTLPVPLKGALLPDVMRSDHAPFWLQNVGAVLVTDTANLRTPHYHQSTDTPETLDRDFFKGAGQLVVNAATALLESRGSLETVSQTEK
jgi:hypothetical protein